MNTPQDNLAGVAIPTSVAEALNKYREQLRSAAGENLICLALYGGVVRGRYQPGQSDINVLVVLKEVNLEILERLAPVLHAAWQEVRAEPFLLAETELERITALFPTKLLDIQRFHRVIDGRDVLSGLQVRREDLCRRIEQELCNLALRLRRRFLSIHQDEQALEKALVDVAVPLRVNFLAMLHLAGREVAEEERTAPVYAAAAEKFKLDAGVLQQLSELRNSGTTGGAVPPLYGATMQLITQAASLVAKLE